MTNAKDYLKKKKLDNFFQHIKIKEKENTLKYN